MTATTPKSKLPLVIVAVCGLFFFSQNTDLKGWLRELVIDITPSPSGPDIPVSPDWTPSPTHKAAVQKVAEVSDKSSATEVQKKLIADCFLASGYMFENLERDDVTSLHILEFSNTLLPMYAKLYPQTSEAIPGIKGAVDEAVLSVIGSWEVGKVSPAKQKELGEIYKTIAFVLLEERS